MRFVAFAATIAALSVSAAHAEQLNNLKVEKYHHGRKLKVSYDAFGDSHSHDELHLMQASDLYHPDMEIIVKGEAEPRTLSAPVPRTYKKSTKDGWMIVTVQDIDGSQRVRATHVDNDDMITTLEHKEGEHHVERRHLDEEVNNFNENIGNFCQLANIDLTKSRGDGQNVYTNEQISLIPQETQEAEDGSRLLRKEGKKSDHKELINARTLRARPALWTECSSTSQIRYFDFGLVSDYSYFLKMGESIDTVVSEIESIVSHAQHVYMHQQNIVIRVSQLVIVTARYPNARRGSTEYFMSQVPNSQGRCTGETIQDVLGAMQLISTNAPRKLVSESNGEMVQQGEWHWITGCYPIPGVVGVAFRYPNGGRTGVMCRGTEEGGNRQLNGYNVGVSSYVGAGTWLVFAHEMGHNWGLDHSFENGQQTTGGVMDYGDNIHIENRLEFNKNTRYSEYCNELRRMVAGDVCNKPWGVDFFEVFTPSCAGKDDGAACAIGYCDKGKCIVMDATFTINGVEPDNEEIEFGWVPSNFETQTGRVTGDLVVASPASACSPINNVAGKWVLVDYRSGSCSMVSRGPRAEAAGAIGVVFYKGNQPNNDDLQMYRGNGRIDIPTIAVTGKKGNELRNSLQNGQQLIVSYGRPFGNDIKLSLPGYTTRPESPTKAPSTVTVPPTISSAPSSLIASTLMAFTVLLAIL